MNNRSRKQRRQRAILSCNDCRRRKLKCDRLDPCNRCIKGGIANSCAYGLEAHSVPTEEPRNRLVKQRRRNASRAESSNVAESLYASESEHDVFDRTEAVESDTLGKAKPQQFDYDVPRPQQNVTSHEQGPKDQVEFLAKSPDLKGISRSSAVMGMLKGRSYGTHFYGASSAMSVVAHVSRPAKYYPQCLRPAA